MSHHLSDPCVHCGLARDAVPVGECVGADLAALAKAMLDAQREALTCMADTDEWLAACERLGGTMRAFNDALAANAAEIERLRAFHNAWVNAEVSHATGNPDLVKKLRAELIAAHKAVHSKLQAPGGGE